jgi:hypothetical protein
LDVMMPLLLDTLDVVAIWQGSLFPEKDVLAVAGDPPLRAKKSPSSNPPHRPCPSRPHQLSIDNQCGRDSNNTINVVADSA